MASSNILLTLHGEVKDRFFDRAAVHARVHRDNVRRLGRIGAFVRQRARTMLRRRKRVSMPGETPSVRSTDSFATLKNILYAMNTDWESVVIGPRFVPSRKLYRSNRASVPELLEKGGTSLVFQTVGRGKERKKISRVANYKPRPFMGPALQAEADAGTMSNVFYKAN